MNKFNVLGVEVDALNVGGALACIEDRLKDSEPSGYVCVTGVHGVIEARKDEAFKAILNSAFLNVPDGMPLVWVGRKNGFRQTGRVYGPDLMLALCELSVAKGWNHFLYGGKPGVAEELKDNLERRFPGIRIAGTYCPPFRDLNREEEVKLAGMVAGCKPHLFWVGLSTPKQERFMAKYLSILDVKVMLGVGAAFDVHTGRIKDAPEWVKNAGLQWFHRLCQEPLRLGPRYLGMIPKFVFLEILQLLGILKFRSDR